MYKIIPHLWFDSEAEEAAKFYVSVFSTKDKTSEIKHISHYGDSGAKISGRPKGSVLTVEFEILGQTFIALNGGPIFKFTEAISFMVPCQNQEEIDYYWDKLSAVKESEQCGWLKDKYGLSWQIVPAGLDKMLQDKDPKKSEKVMGALLKMKKIDIQKLKQVYGKE